MLVGVKENQGRSKKVLQFFIFSPRNFIQGQILTPDGTIYSEAALRSISSDE
jgi:hypothetical protein